ncbi:MAG: 3-hydroxyacyl-CoA dehydrogenase family protein [Pseudomonadota bacterium]
MGYQIVKHGKSRSFDDDDGFLAAAESSGDVVIHLGGGFAADSEKAAVLVELDTESLGVHTGEDMGREGCNAIGFARFINAQGPSQLIELVRQPNTVESALSAAKLLFEEAGFDVVVSADQAGRIIDRLVRPKYNAALRFLDEGLASAEAMDLTCRLGLGYSLGPIEAVTGAGLAVHHDITQSIFAVTGQAGYAPARAAAVAKAREGGQ